MHLVLPEAPNVLTFCFRSPSGVLFNFDPGQFLTLELPVLGGPIYRTYTLSSSPSRPTSQTITVKAQADPVGTCWMLTICVRAYACEQSVGRDLLDRPSAGREVSFHLGRLGRYADDVHAPISTIPGVDPDIVFVHCARRPLKLLPNDLLQLSCASGAIPGFPD
ncbi:hypothetical protein [Mesorhizobium sp. M0514]|uniref:hypothetical protein n=1 Tax=Mesorhizobium sp. M0514 TaxID=2956955 RepID=UPI00333BD79A